MEFFLIHRLLLACVILGMLSVTAAAEPPVRVLFFGDDGPHQPAEQCAQLQPVLDLAAGRRPETSGANIDHPVMPQPPAGLKAFEYEPAKVAFYSPPGHDSTQKNAPLPQMQKPLPPEESRQHAITPVGFHVRLFASEPLLQGKRLAQAFDADGVLCVAESVDYPNDLVEPRAEGSSASVAGHDSIVRFLDSDGDGTADTRQVFTEHLSVPTSLLAHDGGLIVA